MKKSEVIKQIKAVGVLPVIRAESREEAAEIVKAVKAGGISTVEITMTVPNAVKLIEDLSADFGSEILIGAGTVLDAQTADGCIKAGAKFIISPAFNPETVKFCNEREITVMPGALTPTEIVAAWNAGADFVKIFPAGAMGGASYLKALKAPLPHIKMIPTGGVSLATAADFIRAGAEAVGVGSELANLQAVRQGNREIITEVSRKFLDTVRAAQLN